MIESFSNPLVHCYWFQFLVIQLAALNSRNNLWTFAKNPVIAALVAHYRSLLWVIDCWVFYYSVIEAASSYFLTYLPFSILESSFLPLETTWHTTPRPVSLVRPWISWTYHNRLGRNVHLRSGVVEILGREGKLTFARKFWLQPFNLQPCEFVI